MTKQLALASIIDGMITDKSVQYPPESDYDLGVAFEYNPPELDEIQIDQIHAIVARHEGVNDEEDWRWIVQAKDGIYWFVWGGCDFTGWDCRSWLSSEPLDKTELIHVIDLIPQIVNGCDKSFWGASEFEPVKRLTKEDIQH